jgi:hypothetical protein
MEWVQFAIFFIGVFGLFIWNRAESRADIRHMDNQLRANSALIREIHNEIHSEMKEFHGRLERQDAEFKAHMMYYHAPRKD